MRNNKTAEYSKKAQELGIPIVDIKDKKAITDFFTGVVNESAQIDTAKRAQTLIQKKAGTSAGAQGLTGQVRKRD